MHPLWGQRVASYYAERQDVPEYMIALSWVAMILALFAAWTKRKRVASAYALLFGLGFLLALGTTLHTNGQRVYLAVPVWVEKGFTAIMGWLANRLALHPTPSYYDLRVTGAIYVPLPTLLCYLYLPFFNAMRVWTRFGMMSAFALAVLAGMGAARVTRDLRGNQQNPVWALLLMAAIVLELMVFRFPLGWSEVRPQPVDEWLAEQSGGGAVAQFPLSKAEHGLALYAHKTQATPVVYGYGAFFPRRYREARPILWSFPSQEAIALLRDWGVRYVLVGAKSYGTQWPNLQRRLAQVPALRLAMVLDEQPIYHSGWLSEALADFGRAFVVDRVYVYELQ
jgi:hypothetical protein